MIDIVQHADKEVKTEEIHFCVFWKCFSLLRWENTTDKLHFHHHFGNQMLKMIYRQKRKAHTGNTGCTCFQHGKCWSWVQMAWLNCLWTGFLFQIQQIRSKGHTTEGAGEGQAGVMWNLPSPVLHICRVHREDVLWEKQTWRMWCSSSR